MAEWLEHSVQVEVNIPIETAWDMWSNLELMPTWMKWIDSVKISEENPDISRWRLATGGFEFTWQAKIVKKTTHQIIQWESVDGLPNRGGIRFYDRGENSIVKLTVSYSVPGFLALLMNNDFIRKAVEGTLQADMERFKEYAQRAQ
jgi:uncharacterized membrane protein